MALNSVYVSELGIESSDESFSKSYNLCLLGKKSAIKADS